MKTIRTITEKKQLPKENSNTKDLQNQEAQTKSNKENPNALSLEVASAARPPQTSTLWGSYKEITFYWTEASHKTRKNKSRSISRTRTTQTKNRFEALETMETEDKTPYQSKTQSKKSTLKTRQKLKQGSQEKINETQNNTILQWNRRGIWANYEELQQLLTNHDPKIACPHETFLKEYSSIKFRLCHPYNHFNKDRNRTSGEILILVWKDIPQSQIHIDKRLLSKQHYINKYTSTPSTFLHMKPSVISKWKKYSCKY